MKIISRGKTAKDWTAKRTCVQCTSKLEVAFEDLTKCDGDQREPTAYSWKCPVWGHKDWETKGEVEGQQRWIP